VNNQSNGQEEQMDRFKAMQAYCRVVETGGFAAAARALDLSPAVITKYVKWLEDWIQVPLLARTTRRMQVTVQGREFYAHCLRVMCDTEETLAALRAEGKSLAGRLVVTAPVSLTLAWLAPALHAFQSAAPNVTLEVNLNDDLTDLVRDGVDVALRGRARLEGAANVGTALAPIERVLCAAPEYWDRMGRPKTPADLSGHNCLPYVLGADRTEWRFERAGVSHTIRVDGSFRANNSLLIVDALLRGTGASLVPSCLVNDALKNGRLERVLDNYRTERRMLYAVYPARRHIPARARAFVRHMRAALSAS
jgi:DNA-binding transcriptional LysR family regulator